MPRFKIRISFGKWSSIVRSLAMVIGGTYLLLIKGGVKLLKPVSEDDKWILGYSEKKQTTKIVIQNADVFVYLLQK